MTDLQIMIILIEGEYSREVRNTTLKMKNLLLKEFEINVSESEIMSACGLEENYELESKKIKYGYN